MIRDGLILDIHSNLDERFEVSILDYDIGKDGLFITEDEEQKYWKSVEVIEREIKDMVG